MNQQNPPSPIFRKFMIVLASIMCVFYLAYRAIYTFNLSTPYAVFASVFLYVGEFFGIMNLLLYFLQVWEVKEPPMQPVLEGRTVDVLVPTYNEDPALLRATLEACIRMDYPHKTYVLDDGRRPEVEALAAELGAIYITRADNRHAKAGNLNNALEQTDGEFVVVLDADHVPEPHFITRLIGYFSDDKVAFVQTPHAFYNFDSFQARLDHKNRKYWEEGDLFYRVIQPGRNKWNSAIFAGSAAMFRRQALKEIGYIATETITEDLHTGLRLHARGWKSIAVSERLIAGQAPPDISTFHSQRLRWGEGNLSIMAYDNPLTCGGLNAAQRFCYFGSMIHWASGLFKLAIYLTPILMLFTGVPPVREFSWDLIVIIVTYLFFTLYAMKVVSNGYGSIVNAELFSMVNFWTQIKATFRAMFRRRRQRFVVTSKRGPQSKSVWPYVRPQTYLILLSVLAIFWGWLRLSLDLNPIRAVGRILTRSGVEMFVGLGNALNRQIEGTILDSPLIIGFNISDDYFKPVVPTIWCLIFFWLAYKVTQRAFWPANRRFSTRHQVHLPIEYEVATDKGTETHYGVTVDLNDTGMSYIAYEELPINSVIRFTIRGAGEVVKCKGEIRSAATVARGPNADGHRYGVQFQNLTPPQTDAINRMCLHYAVPRMYEQYERGNRDTLWNRFKLWQSRGMAQRRFATRNAFHLPIVINTGTSEETIHYSTTEDVSRVAAAAMFDTDLQPGSDIGYLMATPLGDIRGTARVLRSQSEQIAGKSYYRCVLEFQEFEGQGRTTIQSLVNPSENTLLTPALKPDRKTFLPKMKGPILIGLGLAALLIAAQMGLIFPRVYQDDQFLREMITKVESGQQLTPEEETRYRRIIDGTLGQSHPSTDRLVLLMALGNRRGDHNEVQRVTQFIAVRDTRNYRLSKALVDAYLDDNKLEKAEEEYMRLQKLQDRGQLRELNEKDKQQLKLAGARVAVKRQRYDEAIKRYDEFYNAFYAEVYATDPADALKIRNEIAGVCLIGGNPDKAIAVLTNGPLDVDARKLLIDACTHKKDYESALNETEKLANEPGYSEVAQRIRAEIYSESKDYEKQIRILEELLNRQKGASNPDIVIRLAQAYANQQQFDKALTTIYLVLDNQFHRFDAFDTFVDAASRVKGIERGEVNFDPAKREKIKSHALVLYSVANRTAENPNYAVYLARLGWVLQRVGENDKSLEIVQVALGMIPSNENVRKQLAGVLLKSGRPTEAERVLRGLTSPDVNEILIGIHLEQKQYEEALRVARTQAATDQDWRGEKKVADILSWRGERADLDAAIKIYEKRLREAPQDTDARGRVAEMTLWATKYSPDYFNDAAAKYQALLAGNVKEYGNLYGDGFITATSSARSLSPAQIETAKQLAKFKLEKQVDDPLILSRLAWVLLRAGEKDDARAVLKLALRQKPDKPQVKAELAGVLAEAGLFKEAVPLMADPKTAEDHVALARLYAGAKDFSAAEKHADEALKGNALQGEKRKEAQILQADIISYKTDAADHDRALKKFEELMREYPEDEVLPIRCAEVTLWKKDFDKALERFQALYEKKPASERIWKGFIDTAAAVGGNNTDKKVTPLIPPAYVATTRAIADRVIGAKSRDPLLLARTALVLNFLNDGQKAEPLVNDAVALNPRDPVARRELADILAALGRYGDAMAMYANLTLTNLDRIRLINYATAAENLDAAVREARILLQAAPNDARYKRIMANVLSWRGDFAEALALYDQLMTDNKGKPADLLELQMQMADIILWSRQYPQALEKFGLLVDTRLEEDRVVLGFIDAASSARTMNATQIKQALAIYDRIDRQAVKFENPRLEAEKLTRLAWIMVGTGNPAKADVLLNRVLALDPKDPDVRKELAGVLSRRDRIADAIRIYTSIEGSLDFNDRITFINLLVDSNRKEHQDLINDQIEKLIFARVKPRDVHMRLRFAEMFLWAGNKTGQKRLDQAKEELEKLMREHPREIVFQIRYAQAELWSKSYEEALKRFTSLMEDSAISDNQLQRDVWMGWVDSLTGAVGNIARRAAKDEEPVEKYIDAFFTAERRKQLQKAYEMVDKVRPPMPKDRITNRYLDDVKFYSQSMGRLGESMSFIGQTDVSRELFERAISINREDREIWQAYADALKHQKQFQKAKFIYDALLKNQIPSELPR